MVWRVRPDAGAAGLERVVRECAARYGVPVFLTETSIDGPVENRLRWLEESVAVVAGLRAEGLDVVGYTWWPLFHFVEWEYRESGGAAESHLFEMGLYDLRPNAVGVLDRVRTPVVARFRELAQRGDPVPSAHAARQA